MAWAGREVDVYTLEIGGLDGAVVAAQTLNQRFARPPEGLVAGSRCWRRERVNGDGRLQFFLCAELVVANMVPVEYPPLATVARRRVVRSDTEKFGVDECRAAT
jgi:hypothetical protein